MKLVGKTIVITGGTSGIGYQLVSLLCPTNTVLVIARPGARLENLKREFPRIETYGADLSKPEQYDALADSVLRDHPEIDLLINNAAIQHTPGFLDDDFSFEAIAHEINLNFTAVCSLSFLLLPALLDEQRASSIVNINSGLGLVPKKASAVYCATKGAMNLFSQSLAYQLESSNVLVSQALLPLVETPMTTGRGSGKISAENAAIEIIAGIEMGVKVNNIGKVKLIRLLQAVAPWLIRRILKNG